MTLFQGSIHLFLNRVIHTVDFNRLLFLYIFGFFSSSFLCVAFFSSVPISTSLYHKIGLSRMMWWLYMLFMQYLKMKRRAFCSLWSEINWIYAMFNIFYGSYIQLLLCYSLCYVPMSLYRYTKNYECRLYTFMRIIIFLG